MIFRFSFPVTTKSPNGGRAAPHKMARLLREVRQAVLAMATLDLRGQMAQHLPRIEITYTRHSPATVDDDNLGSALKPVRDAVCQALGLANDSSVLVAHKNLQAKAKPLQPQVDVDVEVRCVTCEVRDKLKPSKDLGELVEALLRAAALTKNALGERS